MKKCPFCGSELPVDARFCGRCGRMQNITSTIDESLQEQQPQLGRWPSEEEQDKWRGMLPHFTLPTGPMENGPPPVGHVPLVQGTPQINGVPMVQGTPSPASGPPAVQGFMHGAAPSSFSSSQAPTYAGQQAPLPQAGPQPFHMPIPQPSHIAPVTPPPHYVPEASPYHVDESAPRHAHYHHKIHHGLGSAPKMVGGIATKWLIIAVVGIVVVGAGGIGLAAYLLTRPQPTISITSNYKVGATPAGAAGTVLHVIGDKFSGTSAITFLLDGAAVSGNQSVHSDTDGNIRADLTITSRWAVGSHTLTAKDANGYTTKSGAIVAIVPQGQAHTPGPFGAPPDDASFTLNLTIHSQTDTTGQQSTNQATLIVTGHPDPSGGTVCKSRDNGQPQEVTSVTIDTGQPFKETYTLSCSGSYKGGKITFMETLTSDIIVFTSSNRPTTCTLNGPHVDEQLSGSYTDQHVFSGTISYPEIPTSAYSCNTSGSYFFYYAGHGTWTGQVAS